MNITDILFYQPIYNLLIIFYRLFFSDLSLAIIAVALLLRLVLYPLTKRQMASQKAMALVTKDMNAELDEVKKKYKNNKEKKDEETIKIQQKYLPKQLGCFTMFGTLIFQSLFFVNFYSVINNLVRNGVESFNKVAYQFVPTFNVANGFNANFLGFIDLTITPNQSLAYGLPVAAFYFALPAIAGILQYISFKAISAQTPATTGSDEFSKVSANLSKQLGVMFSIFVFIFGVSSPMALSLYWTVQSAFVIIQQRFFKPTVTT